MGEGRARCAARRLCKRGADIGPPGVRARVRDANFYEISRGRYLPGAFVRVTPGNTKHSVTGWIRRAVIRMCKSISERVQAFVRFIAL